MRLDATRQLVKQVDPPFQSLRILLHDIAKALPQTFLWQRSEDRSKDYFADVDLSRKTVPTSI